MSTEDPRRREWSPTGTFIEQCPDEAAHGEHEWYEKNCFRRQCPGFVGRAGVPASATPAARWVTCQHRQKPHVLDDECVNATDVPWTPGAGWARVKAVLGDAVPELTDEDFAKADLLIAAAQGPSINSELIHGQPPILDLIRQYGARRVNQEVVPNDRNAAALREMVDVVEARINTDRAESYARGISEGRRQATEQAAQILDPKVVQAYGTDIQTLVGAAVRISHQDGWRQATEGWGAEWAIVVAPGRLPSPVDDVHEARNQLRLAPGRQIAVRPVGIWAAPLVRHRSPYCACGINDAGARFIDPICRLVGPWEPVEQPGGTDG